MFVTLLLCAFVMSDEGENNNGKYKVLVAWDNLDGIVASLDGTIRLQKRSMPMSKDEETVFKLENVGDNNYLFRFTTNRFLCGKPHDAGVVGCLKPENGRSKWTINTSNDKKVAIKHGNNCLIHRSYDSTKGKEGQYLNIKACKKNDTDYIWKIVDIDFDTGMGDMGHMDMSTANEMMEKKVLEELNMLGELPTHSASGMSPMMRNEFFKFGQSPSMKSSNQFSTFDYSPMGSRSPYSLIYYNLIKPGRNAYLRHRSLFQDQ